MRCSVCIGVLALSSTCGHAQWTPIGAGLSDGVRELLWDSTANILYAFGQFVYADGFPVNQTAYWDGSSWHAMGSGVNSTPAFSGAFYNGNVLVGGLFSSAGGAPNTAGLAQWDGSSWTSIGSGIQGAPYEIVAIGSVLYVGGDIVNAGGSPANNIAAFNGSSWSSLLLDYFEVGDDFVNAIADYQGDLIVGGNYYSTNGLKEIGRMVGDTIVAMGAGILGDGWVNDMVVYDGALYVAGNFFQVAGNAASGVMKWDGANWSDPFPGVYYTNQARDFDVYDGKLYIAGPVRPLGDTAQYPYTAARYDGTTLCLLGRANTSPLRILANDSALFIAPNAISTTTYNTSWLMQFDLSFPFDTCMQAITGLPEPPLNYAGQAPMSFSVDPISGEVHVHSVSGIPLPADARLSVWDPIGRLVRERIAPSVQSGSEARFVLGALPRGLYLLQLLSAEEEVLGGGKIAIR